MIDIVNSNMSAYNTATYEVAKEKADASLFEDVLRNAQNIEKKKTQPALGNDADKERERAQLDKKLREACQGFESMFMEMVYKKMRDTVPEDNLLGTSHARKIWQSMLDSEMMKESAKAGGLGLADMLYKELKPTVLANSTIEKTV